jgi:SAM-dependent methyltransferase
MLRRSAAAARNRDAILDVLRRLLPPPRAGAGGGRRDGSAPVVLEIGSGTGEHAVHVAERMPWIVWQPSDPDAASRASTQAWVRLAAVGNVLPPLNLDLLAPSWRLRRADAIVVVNVLHVAPRGAVQALVAGATEVLAAGGSLVVAGPFQHRGPALEPELQPVEEVLRRRRGPFAPSAASRRGAESKGAHADDALPDLAELLDVARRHDLALADAGPLPGGGVVIVLRSVPAAGRGHDGPMRAG